MSSKIATPIDRIENRILLIRGRKVLLDWSDPGFSDMKFGVV